MTGRDNEQPDEQPDGSVADDLEDFLRGVQRGEDMVREVLPHFETAVSETASVARAAAAEGLPGGAFLMMMAERLRDMAGAMEQAAAEYER